ncbi:MAG TPA: hypothetical protein VHC23_04220 [Jatrophihabitans sp.]|nr:hypothetical protein [Jatrophihabitans sp.]
MTAGVITRPVRTGVALTVSGGVTGLCAGLVYADVRGDRMAPWILGRASGVVAYLLLTALVLLGITLSHPRRAARGRSSPARMRAHVTLALLTLAALLLHVTVLATDRYAGVGWWGALLPMRSGYRPVGVTCGVVGVWLGVLAGVTAGLAGHLPVRLWFPVHRVAAATFALAVVHGVLAGSDRGALWAMYLATGLPTAGFAASRYAARRPAGAPP